jgi:CheY-like chemotaxis protein
MQILIIEDDDYKSSDICRLIEEHVEECEVVKAASVTSAMRAVSASRFDLVILDMSLPTFDLTGPGGGGSPQSQGGVEVLRLMRRQKSDTPVVVITQYPDIEFDGYEVPLAYAADRLSDRFELSVKACVAYEFDRGTWRGELIEALRKIDPQDQG